MATLDTILELCDKRHDLVAAQCAVRDYENLSNDKTWRSFLYTRLEANIKTIDAKLERLSGFEEKAIEPFEE